MLHSRRAVRSAALSCLTLLAACLRSGERAPDGPSLVDRTRAEALRRRADSLITRLFDDPNLAVLAEAGITSGDTLPHADATVVEQIQALDEYAEPALIGCLGDTRPSPVTFIVPLPPMMSPLLHPLRGAVCMQIFRTIPAMGNSNLPLLDRAEALNGCPKPPGWLACRAAILDLDAPADSLRLAHAIWSTYWAAREMTRDPMTSEFARRMVGCYEIEFQPPPYNPLGALPPHRIVLALDTIPIPGTVRVGPIVVDDSLRFDGPARWYAYANRAIQISWGDPALGDFFGIMYHPGDPRFSQYAVRKGDAYSVRGRGIQDRIHVRRIGCRAVRVEPTPSAH